MTRSAPASLRFRPTRSKGQCFLKDQRVIERIVGLIAPRPGESLIEVGSGHGQLTLPLARAGARVLAIESDPRLAKALRRSLPGELSDRIEVLEQDALKIDFRKLVSERGLSPVRVCGNLPYSVAAPILLRLLTLGSSASELILMFQKEVAERLTASSGTKAYGFLSVIAQQAAKVEILFRIPPEAFRPRPRVVSALLRFKLRGNEARDVGDERVFRRVVRGLLAHRRKTIQNNVKHLGPGGLEGVLDALHELGIDPSRRAETLSVEEFAELSRICASRR